MDPSFADLLAVLKSQAEALSELAKTIRTTHQSTPTGTSHPDRIPAFPPIIPPDLPGYSEEWTGDGELRDPDGKPTISEVTNVGGSPRLVSEEVLRQLTGDEPDPKPEPTPDE